MPDNTVDDNPDYCGKEGNELRALATSFAEERSKLFTEANKEFESGDKGKAKELSEKGKEYGNMMVETNKKAAAAIIKHNNDGHPDTYLDLHGLVLEEALEIFHERIELLITKSNDHKEEVLFEVIPGAGHHSKGKAIIKPKIIEELQTMKLSFIEKNVGTLLVTINADNIEDTKQNEVKPPLPPSEVEETNNTGNNDTTDNKYSGNTADNNADNDKTVESHGCCIIM